MLFSVKSAIGVLPLLIVFFFTFFCNILQDHNIGIIMCYFQKVCHRSFGLVNEEWLENVFFIISRYYCHKMLWWLITDCATDWSNCKSQEVQCASEGEKIHCLVGVIFDINSIFTVQCFTMPLLCSITKYIFCSFSAFLCFSVFFV